MMGPRPFDYTAVSPRAINHHHHHHQCRRRHYHRYHLCIQKHYPSVIICKHTDTAPPSSLYSFPLFSYPSFLPLFLWRRSVSSRVVTDDQGYLLLSFNSRITLANGTSCTSSATSWPAVHVVPASSCQHVHTWQITGITILLLCRVKHSLCYTETGPTNANSSGTRRQADCLWTRSIAILFRFFFFFSFRSYERKMYISLLPTDENGRCNADADYVFAG